MKTNSVQRLAGGGRKQTRPRGEIAETDQTEDRNDDGECLGQSRLRLLLDVRDGLRDGAPAFCHRGPPTEARRPGRESGRATMPRTILITGCSSGIGQCAAHGMKARGWESSRPRASRRISQRSRRPASTALYLDYTEPDSIEAAVERRSSPRPAARSTRSSTTAPTPSPARSKTCRPTCCARSSRRTSSAGTI